MVREFSCDFRKSTSHSRIKKKAASTNGLVQLQHCKKSLLWNLNITNLAHAFLSFFLLFKQLTLSGNITTITLGSHVFTYCFYRFSGNYFGSNSRLNCYLELLSLNELFQLKANLFTQCKGIILMYQSRQGIHRISVKHNIQFYQIRLLVICRMIIERCITL